MRNPYDHTLLHWTCWLLMATIIGCTIAACSYFNSRLSPEQICAAQSWANQSRWCVDYLSKK